MTTALVPCKATDDLIILRIKNNHTVVVEDKQPPYLPPKVIDINDLPKVFESSIKTCEGREICLTPILPKGCVQYIQLTEGHIVVLECPKQKLDANYHGEVFPDVGHPKLVMFVVVGHKRIQGTWLLAAKDILLRPESRLYKYPYSNIYDWHACCWGTGLDNNEIEPVDLTGYIERFLSLERNDDLFLSLSGMAQREMYETFSGQDFNDNLLRPACTYKEMFNRVRTGRVRF